jgi:hypothetical protein
MFVARQLAHCINDRPVVPRDLNVGDAPEGHRQLEVVTKLRQQQHGLLEAARALHLKQ